MYKDQLNSAMDKIEASEEFKTRIRNSMKANPRKEKIVKRMLFPAFAIVIAVLALGIYYFPSLNHRNNGGGTGEFKITGKMQGEACYISVVYLYGYAYSPSEWLSYSRGYDNEDQNLEAGDKLGDVTLDLKGLSYIGTPPDFSSTYDKGTELYEIQNVKKERAILVRTDYGDSVFYRQNKALSDENEPIDLSMDEVFHMMTDRTAVTSLELRSEEDGSWMRTSENNELISLINRELPKLSLLSRSEIGKERESYRVPVNLMFEDGAALHIQFYPEQQFAAVFGGYINISEELSEAVKQLNKEGEMYDRITDLLPVELSKPSYLYIKNHVDGTEVLCKEPEWSGAALYDMLKYYRAVGTELKNEKQPVITIKAGWSDMDVTEINFYEDDMKNIMIQINGQFYETIKGHLKYEDFAEYLMNYTELGYAE
jgi:hypothetical protein